MKKPRSVDQHRRFFALVKAAFDHWPESAAFRPDSAEHLRAYLTVKAGRRIVNTYYVSADASEFARLIPVIVATMLRKHAWAWNVGDSELRVCVPESIAFDQMGHNEFCALNDDVAQVIEAESGLRADDLLKASEAA